MKAVIKKDGDGDGENIPAGCACARAVREQSPEKPKGLEEGPCGQRKDEAGRRQGTDRRSLQTIVRSRFLWHETH